MSPETVYVIFTAFVKSELVFMFAETNLFQACMSNFMTNSKLHLTLIITGLTQI